MLHIITFVVGTLGTVLLGFPAIALGSFTSWGLREERSPMGGLVPGTLGYNVAMIGSWAIQGGVEFFLAFMLLKALGMTALTWLIILFFVVYTILQYIDQVVHRMPRTVLASCARVFAYFFVAGLLGLNLDKM